jgi:hypothetical protein
MGEGRSVRAIEAMRERGYGSHGRGRGSENVKEGEES